MKCSYVKANGETCQAYAVKDSKYCFTHDPKSKEAHQLAVKKGGLANKKQEPLLPSIQIQKPSDVVSLLEETINLVRAGEIDPKLASTLAYVCSHILKAMEYSDINSKVEMVESILLERKVKK